MSCFACLIQSCFNCCRRWHNLSAEARRKVKNYADLKTAEKAMALCQKVPKAVEGCTWYFNGGDDTILNSISFSADFATISQVCFDGNGKHDNGSYQYTYTVDPENIVVALSDGSSLTIPYKLVGETISVGNGEYYTIDEVDVAIQGCWNYRDSSVILGEKCVSDHSILFENGNVISESASLAFGATNGEYYYYGPYEGTYTLNLGGITTSMYKGNEWFFNIIDGEVVILHYGHVCKPSAGLPGEYGYSF